jgi:hypothetical protein
MKIGIIALQKLEWNNMSSITLSNNAELCISAMHLSSEQAEKVRITVKNYSSRQGYCDALNRLVFRVVDFIKGIFGYSDWQITKKMIQNHAINLVNESLRNDSKPPLDNSSIFSTRVHSITDLLASELLTLSLEIHEHRKEVSTRPDRQNPNATIAADEIAQMDLVAASNKIKALEFLPGIAIGRVSVLKN